jgi:uncharacterized protein YggE
MEPSMSSRTISISLPIPGSRVGWVATGAAIGLLAAVLAGPLLQARHVLATDAATTNEHTIAVSGTGRIVLTPDTADLRLGVNSTAKTVKAARDAAATSMTAVIKSLKDLGIADKDIQTTTLSLQPTYDYNLNTNPPRITGYQLSNAVAVTVRNLDKLGDAIDNALAAGATSLDGVSFRVADQTAAEQQARTAAMDEAKAKATTLAGAANVSITGVASISETVAPVPYPIYYGAGAMAGAPKDVSTPVAPGSTEVTVTVAVVFLIG